MFTTRVAACVGALFLLTACGDDGGGGVVDPVDASPVDTSVTDAVPTDANDVGGDVAVDAGPVADGDVATEVVDIEEPESSPYFVGYIKAEKVPGRLPASACDVIDTHHECVTAAGCGWLRTLKNGGVCRADPVDRCLAEGECSCRADDFHGEAAYDDDLELFLPLSITWRNLAPRTSAYGGGDDRYAADIEMEAILNESTAGFTSRTDFSHKQLVVRGEDASDVAGITGSGGMTLAMKVMRVWDKEPEQMGGLLFEGLGITASMVDDQLSITLGEGGMPVAIAGEHPDTGGLKDYQCNQLALVIPAGGDGTAYLGPVATSVPGLNMAAVQAAMATAADPLEVLRLGAVNAKVWDVRLYTQGRQLTADEVADIGKRCGTVGDYAIPEGYPESNARYSWGMGGYNIVQNHAQQHFSSGVYVTMWVPEPDVFPPTDPVYRDNLNRMIGFWDRWHEQMFFELDLIPFVDNRSLEPAGSFNTYRQYDGPICSDVPCTGEPINYDNPCRYVTDLFQAFNWLPEDFPGEPTSADHRKIAENGGWTRWSEIDPDYYSGWSRPVHEHGHTAHFTLMRTYQKVHHYIRGISGESFAEIMADYVLTGLKSWMSQGLLYYPTVPLAFEGRWDGELERHVFKSSQPYQEKNIDDQGLGARFYGLSVWWTFVSAFAAKPYMVGRISGDTDLTPGTTLQKMRFYLAQEGLDLGELFGNFAAHVATWDWPHIGHHFYEVEQEPFDSIAKWCTENSGPDCTVDSLKIQADVDPELGTEGAWVDSPEGRDPGGFAYSTIRIQSAPAGALYEFSLDFEVPSRLYPDTEWEIGLPSYCRDDPRFFSSRIVVVDAGTEGQEERARRPQYYKIPGRSVDKVIVQVPEGSDANIYLLAIPTPPFELEDVPGFVQGYSLTWPFRYQVRRLAELPEGTEVQPPITLEGDETLDLTPQEGDGFVYDCFAP